MTAFDYDRQCWVSGIEAEQLRYAQLEQELELISGPRGQAYLTFTGCGKPIADVIAGIKAQMEDITCGRV